MEKFFNRIANPFSTVGSLFSTALAAILVLAILTYALIQTWNSIERGNIIVIGILSVYLAAIASILFLTADQQNVIFGVFGAFFFVASFAAIVFISYVIFKANLKYEAMSFCGGYMAIIALVWRIKVYFDDDENYDEYCYDEKYDEEYEDEDDEYDECDEDDDEHDGRNVQYREFGGNIYRIDHDAGTARRVDDSDE